MSPPESATSPVAWLKRHASLLALIAVLMFTAAWNLSLSRTLAEMFTLGVALTLFVVMWHTYDFTRNHVFMYLGCGYFGVGVLGLFHALGFAGSTIYGPDTPQLAAQFGLAARGVEALAWATSPWFFRRPLHGASTFGGFGLLVLLLVGLIFSGVFLPVPLPSFEPPPASLWGELPILAFWIIALGLYLRFGGDMAPDIRARMLWAMGFSLAGEVMLGQFFPPHDLISLAGQCFSLISIWLIFNVITATTLTRPFLSLARNSGVYDALPIPIAVLDSQGIIRQANRAAVDAAGTSWELLVGQHCHEPLHSEIYPRDDCPVCANLHAMTPLRDLEWKNQGKWQSITLAPLDPPLAPHSDPRGMIQVGIDISRRKKAEEAQRQAQADLENKVTERTRDLHAANVELQKLSRLKDDFLAGVSHELRSPLNSILGSAEILLEHIYGPLTEPQTKNLQRVQESGRHLLSLINDILDVAKVEGGNLRLHPETIDPHWVCESGINRVRNEAFQKNLQLVTDFDPEARALVADPMRLKQILINLLGNAVKFTRQGGKIGLTTQGDREREKMRFIVWDTGIGMEPAQADRLFKPFMQWESGLSREYEGSGLGLSLVKSLTEMHGGEVSLETAPGQGSRFTIELPWSRDTAEAAPKVEEPPPEPSPPRPAGPSRILIVDDNINNLETVCEYLEVSGYEILRAMDGQTGIQIARNHAPELILMDIQMPGMDGLEAMRILRADTNTANIPIIALTALAMAGDRELCLEAGADDYLGKPVRMKVLREKIEHCLRMGRVAEG